MGVGVGPPAPNPGGGKARQWLAGKLFARSLGGEGRQFFVAVADGCDQRLGGRLRLDAQFIGQHAPTDLVLMQRHRTLAAFGQLADQSLMHLLVPRLQRQLPARPDRGLDIVAVLLAGIGQTCACLPGQMRHLFGCHHHPFLELRAVAELEAIQEGAVQQRQCGLTVGHRCRTAVFEQRHKVGHVNGRVAGRVELEGGLGDEQKGWLGGGVG